MRHLMLLRHAKSDWSATGTADHDRTLNARGRSAATRMGKYMAKQMLIPVRILCSTATRTRETCALLTAKFPRQVPVDFEDRLYEAAPETIVDLIAATPQNVRSLLVIGHNPGMQLAALSLCENGHSEHRAKLAEKYPTAALAIIDFETGTWTAVKSEPGHLERFVVPREIAQAD